MGITDCATASEARSNPPFKSPLSHTDVWTSIGFALPPIGRLVLVDYRPDGTETCSEDHRTVELATFQIDQWSGRPVCRLATMDGTNRSVTVWRDLPQLPPSKPE